MSLFFRNKLLLLITGILLPTFLFSQSMKVTGMYQGKNIYILNPLLENNSFCITSIELNGTVVDNNFKSSALEIDLSKLSLSLGDEIILNIIHNPSCVPVIINPEVLKIKSTFNVSIIRVNRTGELTWKASGETGKLNYIIEQYRWNKWIEVGSLMGKGTEGTHEYSYKINLNSGANKFRVKQVDYTKIPRYSREGRYTLSGNPIEFDYNKSSKTIHFSAETMFELYDLNGALIKKGIDKDVDLSQVTPGEYYLNYDNSTESLKVK